MSAGLVASGIQVEGNHQLSAVLGGVDVVSAICVGHVGVEEAARGGLVQVDSVSLDLNGAQSGHALFPFSLAVGGGGEVDELLTSGVQGISEQSGVVQGQSRESDAGRHGGSEGGVDGGDGHGSEVSGNKQRSSVGDNCGSELRGSGDSTGGGSDSSSTTIDHKAVLQSAQIGCVGHNLGEHIPRCKHLGLEGINVIGRTQTEVHGLNGPLHLVQQQLIARLVDTQRLQSVNTDKGESNTLDENIVTMIPITTW